MLALVGDYLGKPPQLPNQLNTRPSSDLTCWHAPGMRVQ